MRLDQFLSARTMYSRRELRQMIQKGKATVDGAVVRKADQHVQPDEIFLVRTGNHQPCARGERLFRRHHLTAGLEGREQHFDFR